ncbi:MAG: hypothetical protein AAGJ50_16020, partial [Pseudomonadota bacterium]
MRLLSLLLKRAILAGKLTVTDHDGSVHVFGPGADENGEPGEVAIRLTVPGASGKIARDPALGAAEAYMEGRLEMEAGHEIYDLLKLVTYNFRWVPGNELHKITQQPRWKTWWATLRFARAAWLRPSHHVFQRGC